MLGATVASNTDRITYLWDDRTIFIFSSIYFLSLITSFGRRLIGHVADKDMCLAWFYGFITPLTRNNAAALIGLLPRVRGLA